MTDYSPLPEDSSAPKPATEATIAIQQTFKDKLDFSNRQSFADAERGLIATIDPMTIAHDHAKRAAFDLSQMGFLQEEAPDTVNPSLWRQAQLNAGHHGLYKVVEGIYQIRSFDIANMTLIRGDTGWIIIDPLTSSETSRAGLELANKHLGQRPVVAVIHTHSHADHFAGVLGVITADQAESGEVAVIAPGFRQRIHIGKCTRRKRDESAGHLYVWQFAQTLPDRICDLRSRSSTIHGHYRFYCS